MRLARALPVEDHGVAGMDLDRARVVIEERLDGVGVRPVDVHRVGVAAGRRRADAAASPVPAPTTMSERPARTVVHVFRGCMAHLLSAPWRARRNRAMTGRSLDPRPTLM